MSSNPANFPSFSWKQYKSSKKLLVSWVLFGRRPVFQNFLCIWSTAGLEFLKGQQINRENSISKQQIVCICLGIFKSVLPYTGSQCFGKLITALRFWGLSVFIPILLLRYDQNFVGMWLENLYTSFHSDKKQSNSLFLSVPSRPYACLFGHETLIETWSSSLNDQRDDPSFHL